MKNNVLIYLLILSVLVMSGCKSNPDFSDMLLSYCTQHSSVAFQDVTDFEWDIAYVDYESYGEGEIIKEKYGLTGDFEELDFDFLFRIAFYKNGNLVNDSILNSEDIALDSSIEIINPNTVFNAKWETDEIEQWGTEKAGAEPEYIKILCLSLKK